MQLAYDAQSGLFYRPGTHDAGIIAEQRHYAPLRIQRGDVILDAGANIGAFSLWALRQGADVVAVEPEAENYAILERNLAAAIRAGRAKCVQAALCEKYSGAVIPLYVQPPTGNSGLHSLFKTRGGKPTYVTALSWENCLVVANFSILKIDVEGGEYELLPEAIPATVRQIAVELHFDTAAWKIRAYVWDDRMRQCGWKSEKLSITPETTHLLKFYNRV